MPDKAVGERAALAPLPGNPSPIMTKERISAIRLTMVEEITVSDARKIITELLLAVDKPKKRKPMIDDDPPLLDDIAANPGKKARGTIEEFQAFAKSIELPATDGEAMYWKFEGNGWKNGNGPVKDWKAVMRQWKAGGYHPSQRGATRANGHGHQSAAGPTKCVL